MDGIEVIKAPTTSFMPSFLETILRGLSARKALKAFSDFKESLLPPPVMIGRKISSKDDMTTKKSRQFQ